ncbi:hypothetical protein [Streptomyces sp. NPDC001880]
MPGPRPVQPYLRPDPETSLLTEREREVAGAPARGRSDAETAATPCPGVTTGVSRILAGFGFTDRVRIALLVHDAGLLDDDGVQPAT